MNFISRIVVLFFIVIMLFFGVILGLYALNQLPYFVKDEFSFVTFYDPDLRIVTGGLAVFILVMNFILYQIFSLKSVREKVIAFDNPSGQVIVSLQALEDLVKRVLAKSYEITDIKPKLAVSKKGLHVSIRLILRSDVNIPTLTSRIQDLVKRKIQDTIGIDEAIDVSIFVNKIIPEEATAEWSKKQKASQDDEEPRVPFHGYRP